MMSFAADRPQWDREGRDWPNRESSRFVTVGGLRWHVQEMGPDDGPVLLLLHGTGAATHSWGGLMPLLARRFRVIAPDLPGHGFTGPLPMHRLSLPGVAGAVGQLIEGLEIQPGLAVGHSAGAAILCRMALDGTIDPALIVSLNGALKPFPGLAGAIFPPIAKLLFTNPLVPRFFAWSAGLDGGKRARKLIADTGSEVDARTLGHYVDLMRCPGHAHGALGMMAGWDLGGFQADLPGLRTPLVLVAGALDRTVDPEVADRVAGMVHAGRAVHLEGLGHLAHEEDPARLAALILKEARAVGLNPPDSG